MLTWTLIHPGLAPGTWILSALAAALPQGGARVEDGLFARRAALAPDRMELEREPSAYARLAERHARGEPFELAHLPLPGGAEATLELRPVGALAPGARGQVVHHDGSIETLAPRVRCFAGRVLGGGTAFLGLTPEALDGYLEVGGALYFLSSDALAPGRVTLARAEASNLGGAPFCALDEGRSFREPGTPAGSERALVPLLRTAELFVEADDAFRARFTSAQACFDYAVLLFTAASEVYRRDLGVRLVIPDLYLRVWNTTPPWGAITGFSDLAAVYGWWQSASNPLRATPRAAVHVLTHPIFGGTARGTGGLCDTARAYEISSLGGRFPYPTQHTGRDNWDLFVVCHELGHTFGSIHSADYTPPILCDDGSGPDRGTLMSYCNTTLGIASVGMRFHLREQERIRGVFDAEPCLSALPLAPGDYDGDGALTAADLASLRAVLTQGFRSLGAEEALDMDGDGALDAIDEALLAARVSGAPPARVRPWNGSGVDPLCLRTSANPVLGTRWPAQVRASGAGSRTLLFGFDQPLPGLPTPLGELLVRTTTFGGTRLYGAAALSDGTQADYALDLPLDPALAGRTLWLQALVLGADDGDHYCNALELLLSTYE